MKRIALGILVLIFFGSFALAREEVAGTWYLTEGETESVRLSAREVGLEMTLTLNPDGSMRLMGTDMEDVTGTWKLQKDVLYLYHDDGDISRMEYENGRLSIEDGGVIMYFDRAIQTEQPTGLTVRSDVQLSDFAGLWEGISVAEEGRCVPLGVLGAGLTLDIEGDQVTMTMVLGGEKTGDTLTARLQQERMIMENEDMTAFLQLMESGEMSCQINGLQFILQRAEKTVSQPDESAVLSDYNGHWIAEYGEEQGTRLTMAALDMDMELEIQNGQVGLTVRQAQEAGNMTWQSECTQGALIPRDETGTKLQLLENGWLVCSWEDVTLFLSRQETGESSPVVTEAVLSDFDGHWTAVYGVSRGVQVAMEDMQAAMHLTIANGKVTVNVDSVEGSSQRTIRGTLNHGTLTIIDAMEGSIMDLRLHENGMLSCTMGDTPVYFEKDTESMEP